jgi:hypothetical protein
MKGLSSMKPALARCASISGIILCSFGLSAGLAQSQGSTSSWFRIPLKGGELRGSQWGFAATGSKERPLRQVCAVVSEVAPPEPGVEFAEGSETSSCGSLLQATDSITVSTEFGTDESDAIVLRTALYPRGVQRVIFVLAGGEELTYRARGIKVRNRKAKGIPFFRYLVARFSGDACIQQVISYDGRDRLIKMEKGDKSCP